MSTRSGKRIHSTLFENTDTVDSEVVTKLGKRTRNKRFKENDEHQDATMTKSKKQKHYVTYPTDDEGGYVTATDVQEGAKSSRKTKKNALKEHDINVLDSENIDTQNEEKKTARVTRQTRKFADDRHDVEAEVAEEPLPIEKVKSNKNKKKKSKCFDVNENVQESVQDVEVEKVSKKSKKKKKGKSKKSSTEGEKQTLNKSNLSTDSFHSAAGSPSAVVEDIDVDTVDHKTDILLVKEDELRISNTSKKDGKKKRNSSFKPTTPEKDVQEIESTSEKDLKKAKKSSLKNKIDEKEGTNTVEEVFKVTENDKGKKRKSSLKTYKEEIPVTSNDLNSTYDKNDIDVDNTTLCKVPKARRSLRLNDSTIENTADITIKGDSAILMFENNTTSRKSTRSSNSATDDGKDISSAVNTTYEKNSDQSLGKTISLNSTFDKSSTKLNTTFDKIEPKIDSGKSSLITSDDGTVNITFDKEDNSRISITSDESNIVNTTPVLIESSLDESKVSGSNISKSPEVLEENTAVTSLKREGTFTKESPEVNKTPTKRQTLPSPGFTPFHVTRSSNKEKSVLNVTRSLEKPAHRSSLADMAPTRQTRVMFCSPMNNPAVALQQKKKVIKSSMKGSNKSFVFDDTASSVPRPSARKRSLTHDDASDSRAKRKRLAEDLQLSVDRLSRPRTSSAAAKLPETTPSRKLPTPSKPKTEPKRTKLPNFAALHQKQFDKMESLTECQQRKMKRAKKLLVPKTPNGTVMVLERSSPRGTAESPKLKDTVAKKSATPVKLETSSKNTRIPSNSTKLPTLESLRPGFTRFGFKMLTDFNPFSVPSKSESKPKTKGKQNGVATVKQVSAPKTPALTAVKLKERQTMLPSLNGITTTRKEAAKLAVMREKSFTSVGKRDAKRSECRTIIKGVRTNRRFELQMKMRNID